MRPRVTQRDIARAANVSHVTVSLALRGERGIPERTRQRIEKIAALLGYTPDPMLSALSSYRKSNRPAAYQANIGWLGAQPLGTKDYGGFFRYFEGAQLRAQQLGYVLDEISLADYHKDFRRLQRLLGARNITGLILAPSAIAGDVFKFDLSHYSVVRLGYSYASPLSNTVANTQFRTVLTAMERVVALGYRRIGIILTEVVDQRTSWHFLGGYLAGQHLIPKENWLAPFYDNQQGELAPAVYEWIVREKVDCLIGAGYGALYHDLIKLGLDMPGTVGYADTQLGESETFFSGIHQNDRQIGVATVDLLVGMMHRSDTGVPAVPSHLLIEGSWRDGKTLMKQRPRVGLQLAAG